MLSNILRKSRYIASALGQYFATSFMTGKISSRRDCDWSARIEELLELAERASRLIWMAAARSIVSTVKQHWSILRDMKSELKRCAMEEAALWHISVDFESGLRD